MYIDTADFGIAFLISEVRLCFRMSFLFQNCAFQFQKCVSVSEDRVPVSEYCVLISEVRSFSECRFCFGMSVALTGHHIFHMQIASDQDFGDTLIGLVAAASGTIWEYAPVTRYRCRKQLRDFVYLRSTNVGLHCAATWRMDLLQ